MSLENQNNPDPTKSATAAEAISLAANWTPTVSGASATRGLWVGGGGNVVVDFRDAGTNITLQNVPAGTLLPVIVTKVYSTGNGTTASAIVALY